MGRVATIPAGEPFADRLAARMLAMHGPAGDGRLADALVLLPTRRAIQSLTEAFLRVADGHALLLPCMRPLGDLNADEPPLASLDPADEGDLPGPVPELRRMLVLARMVQARGDLAAGPAAALALGRSLAGLLDEVQSERLDFGRLQRLVPDEYQRHWQTIVEFLSVVTDAWPAILAGWGQMDPAMRRDRLMQRLADRWRRDGTGGPVWIAGSTGSVPGTADLMAAALASPDTAIVLPGFETAVDPRERQAILAEPGHPQHGMHRLLARLHVDADRVETWSESGPSPRALLLREVMRPASTTERWARLDHVSKAALDGLSVTEAPTPQQEATAIALRLREVLEVPGRTAALVTPDRTLARRVAAELGRFGIAIDDSGGTPLRHTPVGTFLLLLARVIRDGFPPADLLSLLGHPLCGCGIAPAEMRRRARRLDRRLLRGVRAWADLGGLVRRATELGHDAEAFDWLGGLDAATAPMLALDGGDGAGLADWIDHHVRLAEWVAATDTETGADRLWRGEAGELAAGLLSEAREAAADAAPVRIADWPDLLDELIGGATVRPRHGTHPRLRILGPLEARLQGADRIILGGLNEGSWPAPAHVDPWMSRPMRAAFGLPEPERRLGLQAHDFASLAAAPEVILSRALKSEGTPTVASRWLQRLRSVVAGAGLDLPLDVASTGWAAELDRPAAIRPVAAPAPRPPLALRPTELPVTDIEKLIRDPYAIFARRVLRLRALDPLDEEPGPAMKGNLIHAAFEELARARPGVWHTSDWAVLEPLARKVFDALAGRPAIRELWWRRFERAARWLLSVEHDRPVRQRMVETRGSHPGFPELPGFVLTARADRIDMMQDGSVAILDYKTGIPPTQRQIEAGFAVQMPLQALILQQGGFTGVPAGDKVELVHIRVSGGRVAGEWKPVKDVDTVIDEVRDGLVKLLTAFSDERTPYLSRPRVQFTGHEGDYDHLARVREWSVAGERGGAEGGE
ncbi:MAG: double-strand break repair protein AddB [Pseudomonadota bacterium]|nr:double-strand break repair protein AddB [Pseudomonadota bacterium]